MAKLYESLGQNPPQKKESKENFLPDTKLQPSSRTVMKTLYNCFFFLKKRSRLEDKQIVTRHAMTPK